VKLTVEYLTFPREGEQENGDAALVRPDDEGGMVAVIDALGHGARAAETAAVATAFLAEVDLAAGLRAVVEGLHVALRGTRGAAAMVLRFSAGKVEGIGVGNVEARAHAAKVPVVLTPGVLGSQVSRLKVFEAKLRGKGRLAVFSDGVSRHLALDDLASLVTRDACRALMDRYRRPGDDATVLVTDFEA
jgi:negative regulator of sigma-B (phosphoserine phosphatase)